MTSLQTTTQPEFDEAKYAADLIKAGLPSDDAYALAAKTAQARKAAFEDAAFRRGLIDSGIKPDVANKQTAGARRILDLGQNPQPEEPPRKNGFVSVADMLGGPAAKSDNSEATAPPVATKPSPAKPIRTVKKDDKLPETYKPMSAVFDYKTDELPARVRDLIEASLAIERQDAKGAGTLGFMTRSLAIATLPHRKTKDFRFVRKNGDFTLTMMTAHPLGLPYGRLPRLLLTWVCTEVAQKRERVLHLGNNLAEYLNELGLHQSGGKRGDITRLKHAMTTLFSSVISCHYDGKDSFALQNVLLADKVDWWTPQNPEEAGEWQSSLMLSEPFFKECIEHVLPFDMRAVRALGASPLAFDIYVWLTYRMSYLSQRTIIPWVALAGQFGAGYAMTEQGLRDFKRAFIRELKHVLIVYSKANARPVDNGLMLLPSPTHISHRSTPSQQQLGF